MKTPNETPAAILKEKIAALNEKANAARSEGDRDSFDYFVDKMIDLENAYFDAGHNPSAYSGAVAGPNLNLGANLNLSDSASTWVGPRPTLS